MVTLAASFVVGLSEAGLLVWLARRLDEHARGNDPATGLSRRKTFMRALDRRLRRKDKELTLIAMDISGLRAITETHGWVAGDHMMAELASRMIRFAGKRELAARLSGHDFVIALPGATDSLTTAQTGRELMFYLEAPVTWQNQKLRVRVGLGIVMAPAEGKTSCTLFHSLATALAAAKKQGPGSICFFDKRISEELAARGAIEQRLRAGLDERSFHLALQPVFELRQRRLKGFEALIRLDDPEIGSVSPASFIPVAEQSGLIDDLGAWTLMEACRIASGWPDHYKIAVNLSPVQFRSGHLIAMVRDTLEKTGFPAWRLELEVTEGLLLEDSEFLKTQVAALQEMGVCIVLDDFGTGYSSLSYLWQYPFRKLKIDRAFIKNMEGNTQVQGILRTIIALARSLGMPVTAEGIETETQAQWLANLGCEEGQGYHLGRPMSETDAHMVVLRDLAHRGNTTHASQVMVG